MSKYFGTDGFRGEANVVLTVEHAFQIGRFLGWYYGKEALQHGKRCKVVIGKDTRRSSYMFEYSLVSGLTASGADVYLMHVTTTPSVSFVTRSDDFQCGIMISASHNPFYDNGIKIMNSFGQKLEDEVIEQIEAYLDGTLGELPYAKRDQIGKTVDFVVGRDHYRNYLISLATRSYEGMRIGLDCSNGSASTIAKDVFDALGAKTYVIHSEPNGTNINTDCGSTNINVLQDYVLEHNLDVGFAFDGDADRCIAVDERGNVINGDKILYVYGSYMKERGRLSNNTVVATVMSNLGLFKGLEALGIECVQTAVGDKYVYECMNEFGYRLGGEESGHIIFGKYGATGDGILTAIKMMQVILHKGKPLSQLAAPFREYPQVTKNVRVKDKPTARQDKDVEAMRRQIENELGEDGRIIIRESGTEPVIRVMVEAASIEVCNRYADQVIAMLHEKGHVVSGK